MKILTIFLIFLFYFILETRHVSSQITSSYKLPPLPSYVILAPKQIRPGQMYQASITVIKLLYKTLNIRMTIKQDDTEYIHDNIAFQTEGTQLMRLEIPPRISPGASYFLEVVGSISLNSAIIFSNRTKLEYVPKEYSVLIQTSKPVYHQSQTVQFRVIPLQANLMPVFGTVSSIQAVDANGFVVKRWLNPTTTVGGIYELQFPLADQVTEGMWAVEVELEKWKARKTFEVREYWLPRFDVNISLPVRLSELGFGVYGIVQANKTSGILAVGNANITLQIRDPTLDRFTTPPLVQLFRNVTVFTGKADFLFTMTEIKLNNNQQSLANKDVWVNATVYDSFSGLYRSGWAYTFIFSDDAVVKFLGGLVRPYKPGMLFSAYIVVYQPDGTKVINTNNRNVQLSIYCNDNELVQTFKALIVPESGIIRQTFVPVGNCLAYRMRAEYLEDGNRVINSVEQRLFKYYSQSGAYMQIVMATDYPKVNEFAVFFIQMNYPTSKLFIHVIAGGNIVYIDTLVTDKAVKTRTFSMAISRDMAPVARLVAYYVKTDGEVISDSLTFFANITNMNNVKVGINRGKDLNVDTLEINGYATPGSYLALNVLHYDLYSRGADNILRDYNIIDEMLSYEKNFQQPFQHNWYYDLEYIVRSYVPSASFGADTNTTLNSSGLIIFSDANYTKINFYNTCNETRDISEAFPCYSYDGKQCYSRKERCDGVNQCLNWVDEMGCEVNNTVPKPKDMLKHFDFIYRHWNDGAWLWKTYWIKPNGRINFRVDLPKMDTSWVVGAYAIDREQGFSFIQRPALFSGIRRFYMVVEMPEESFYGEQIGVRITLFNYWDYWTEALLEVKRSDQYKIVQVGNYGLTSAFNPDTISNKSVHTLVYLNAGESRFIFIPIIPRGPGNSTINICAYTFIGSNCEIREVRVTMNGVENHYHTSNLVDLTSNSRLQTWNFKIPLRQSFYEPEQRNLRWVPDSKFAKVTVSGDIVGPTPSHKLKFVNTYDGLRLSHGAAENVFFEFGYNVELLRYLRKDQSTSLNITISTLNYCNMILQDCLSYFDTNSGGFANFRESRNKPNVLATALALWNLYGASYSDWDRYVYISPKLFNASTYYIASQQELTGILKGSFPLTDILDNRFLPTNISATLVGDYIEAQRRIPVTAMVVISLSDQNSDVNPAVISAAIEFIRQNILSSVDIFTQIIGTYAMSKSGLAGAKGEISTMLKVILQNSRKEGEAIYFSNTKIYPQVKEQTNAATIMISPRIELANDGYTVASSALAMLLLNDQKIWSETNNNSYNLELIQWLARMRNHVSAFASTFDSICALKALNNFVTTDRNRKLYKLEVKEELSSASGWMNVINIIPTNYSVGNMSMIHNNDVWGEVVFSTQGTGRVLLQMDVFCRVFDQIKVKNPLVPENPDILYPSYDVNCSASFSGKNSSIMHVDVCGRWTGTYGALGKPEAGMSVFELEVPTGFVVLNDDLRRYVESMQQPLLRYARFWPGKINFYLTKMPSDNQTCVRFRADRYFPVANVTRDHLCSVYEYYEPGRYNRSIYFTVDLYSNHICNVFGSYQCPYSGFFNVASYTIHINFAFVLLSSCLILFIRHYFSDFTYLLLS